MKKRINILYIEGIISIIVNTALFAAKYIIGISTHSIAIIADAWHSLSDSLTSVILIVGAKASQKPPDKEHPFGHERIELIVSIIIGVLLMVVSLEFLQKAIIKLLNREITEYTVMAKIVMIGAILSKEALAQFAFFWYKKTSFAMLKADGWHHRSDAFSSVTVLVGIYLGKYFWWADGIFGIGISLLIGYTAFEIIRDGVNPLLGEAPDERLIERVKGIVTSISGMGDLNVHHFHIHNYGGHRELTFHLIFSEDMKIKECHKIATEIEKKIKEDLNIDATIHLESE